MPFDCEAFTKLDQVELVYIISAEMGAGKIYLSSCDLRSHKAFKPNFKSSTTIVLPNYHFGTQVFKYIYQGA